VVSLGRKRRRKKINTISHIKFSKVMIKSFLLQFLVFASSSSLVRSHGLQFAAEQFERPLFRPAAASLAPPATTALPSLLQHADGRFFAVNVDLRPGQFFRTPDGRVFTLAAPSSTATAGKPLTAASDITASDVSDAALDIRGQGQQQPDGEDEDLLQLVDGGADEPASILARDATTTTTEPPPSAVATAAPARAAAAVGPKLIASAPLTHSTARFLGAAAPFGFEHPFFGAPAPAATYGVPVVSRVFAAPDQQAAAVVGQGGRHLLADSNTGVFRGFFTYPGAGIDFDF
jgi:hypothetical protein